MEAFFYVLDQRFKNVKSAFNDTKPIMQGLHSFYGKDHTKVNSFSSISYKVRSSVGTASIKCPAETQSDEVSFVKIYLDWVELKILLRSCDEVLSSRFK